MPLPVMLSIRREGMTMDESGDDDNSKFWVGVGIVVAGNFLGSVGPPLQRVAHQKNSTGVHFTRIPLWWVGMLCMASGEVGNFLAYGFCPASVVAPLGAIGVVSTAVFSRVVLKEHLSWRAIGGIGLALVGAVLIAFAAPDPQHDPNAAGELDDTAAANAIYDSLITWRAFGYIAVVLALFFAIANPWEWAFAVSQHTREHNVVWNTILCGLMGAITVSSSKGFSTAISQAFSGNFDMFVRRDICWLTYLLVLSAVGSIIQQLKYLNQALMHFGSSLVVPVYYVIFTSITMSAGMVLFLEIDFDPPALTIPLFILGVALAFVGVYFMNCANPGENNPSHDDIKLSKLAHVDLSDVPLLREQALAINLNELDAASEFGRAASRASAGTEMTSSSRLPSIAILRSMSLTGSVQVAGLSRVQSTGTTVTVANQDEIRALFNEMDSGGDGLLDEEDLRRWGAGADKNDPEQARLADELVAYFLPGLASGNLNGGLASETDAAGAGPGKMTYAEFEAWYRRDLEGSLRSLHHLVLAARLKSKGPALAVVVATPGLGLLGSLFLTHKETAPALNELVVSVATAGQDQDQDAGLGALETLDEDEEEDDPSGGMARSLTGSRRNGSGNGMLDGTNVSQMVSIRPAPPMMYGEG